MTWAKPENQYERGGGDLLEVYTPSGRQKASRCSSRRTTDMTRSMKLRGNCLNQFVPIVVGGVLLLALLQFPARVAVVEADSAGPG